MRILASLALAAFSLAALPAPAQSVPGYQSGTIQLTASHELNLIAPGRTVLVQRCGNFQSGQAVLYRIDGDSIYLRPATNSASVHKCSILQTTIMGTATAPAYQSGEVLGYFIHYYPQGKYSTFGMDDNSGRIARVYELKGARLFYLFDFCGSFQAGKFSPGQTVQYHVDIDNDRINVRQAGDKEYSCKLEGMHVLEPTAGLGAF